MRRLIRIIFTFAAIFGLATGSAAAATRTLSGPENRTAVSLTIYNDNLGLVREVREIQIPRGMSELWFAGVAAQIDPTSVSIRSLDAPSRLSVLEQNFEYDLISPERLMEKYLGMEVQLISWRHEREDTIQARLIGNQNGYVYEIDGKIAINPGGRVVLPALPEGLISEPSLVWLLESAREQHRVQASYLTGGISWKADYVAVLSKGDDLLDLSGWVTIMNNSGATWENAGLQLVAGDVNRVQDLRMRMVAAQAMMTPERQDQFQEEAFFEYHLYTLERPTTIRDRQTKQLSLLNATGVEAVKTYIYQSPRTYWLQRDIGGDVNTKVGVYLSFENAQRNQLGIPLPRGVVRVYKEDAQGSLQFVGEDRIDHTPRDERVRVRMGNAFDIVGERVQTDYEVLASGRLYRSSYRVTLRNHKDEAVTVSVVEALVGDWEIEGPSHPFEKESSHRVRFDLPVPARGETVLSFTALVRY